MKDNQSYWQRYNWHGVLFLSLFFSILLLPGLSLHAHIIEPDNIIYGEIFHQSGQKISSDSRSTRITLEVNQVELSSYTMGDDLNAGDHFILRVPLDFGQPVVNNRAHTGDIATIKVNGQNVLSINSITGASIAIGARGTVSRKNLSIKTCLLCGDANGDGKVSINDALMIAQYVAKLIVPNPNLDCWDVDGNGKVDIYDALKIAQYVAKLIPNLDCK